MASASTSSGETAATDWNWKPIAVRAKNSTHRTSQRF